MSLIARNPNITVDIIHKCRADVPTPTINEKGDLIMPLINNVGLFSNPAIEDLEGLVDPTDPRKNHHRTIKKKAYCRNRSINEVLESFDVENMDGRKLIRAIRLADLGFSQFVWNWELITLHKNITLEIMRENPDLP